MHKIGLKTIQKILQNYFKNALTRERKDPIMAFVSLQATKLPLENRITMKRLGTLSGCRDASDQKSINSFGLIFSSDRKKGSNYVVRTSDMRRM